MNQISKSCKIQYLNLNGNKIREEKRSLLKDIRFNLLQKLHLGWNEIRVNGLEYLKQGNFLDQCKIKFKLVLKSEMK